jgi:hypothetical protein
MAETTAARRSRVNMKGEESQNTKQKPLRSLQLHDGIGAPREYPGDRKFEKRRFHD